jgi:hypothetical protein
MVRGQVSLEQSKGQHPMGDKRTNSAPCVNIGSSAELTIWYISLKPHLSILECGI